MRFMLPSSSLVGGRMPSQSSFPKCISSLASRMLSPEVLVNSLGARDGDPDLATDRQAVHGFWPAFTCCHVSQRSACPSWNESSFQSAPFWAMNRVKGYGIPTETSDDGTQRYHLVLPKGVEAPLRRVEPAPMRTAAAPRSKARALLVTAQPQPNFFAEAQDRSKAGKTIRRRFFPRDTRKLCFLPKPFKLVPGRIIPSSSMI
jgi:hypothetical protein